VKFRAVKIALLLGVAGLLGAVRARAQVVTQGDKPTVASEARPKSQPPISIHEN
jgi:hypothetical protein